MHARVRACMHVSVRACTCVCVWVCVCVRARAWPTLLVDVEVLQALVEVAGRGGRPDVGVGVDRAQPGDGRAVPPRGQAARL